MFDPLSQTGPIPGQVSQPPAGLSAMVPTPGPAPQTAGSGAATPTNAVSPPSGISPNLASRIGARQQTWAAGAPMPTSRASEHNNIPPAIHDMLMARFAGRPAPQPTGPYNPAIGGVPQPRGLLAMLGYGPGGANDLSTRAPTMPTWGAGMSDALQNAANATSNMGPSNRIPIGADMMNFGPYTGTYSGGPLSNYATRPISGGGTYDAGGPSGGLGSMTSGSVGAWSGARDYDAYGPQ